MPAQQIDHLVKMANQIALNFGANRNMELAARKTGEHLDKFWTPAMREQLHAYWMGGGEGIFPAVERLLAGKTVDSD